MLVRPVVSGILVVVVAVSAASPASSSAQTRWRWPTDPHEVVRAYAAPATPYAAGHRGIDLAARPGQPVAAPADGVVSFAAVVVDRPLVTLRLAGDLLVTLEPVRPAVHPGDRVRAGDVLGQVAAGGHCAQECLHLGARLHGGYVSPLRYLGGIPRAILLPLSDAAAPGQARGWAVR